MKKVLSIAIVVVICLSFAISAMAAGAFVPSVTAKPAPEVVEGDNDKAVIEIVGTSKDSVATFDVKDVEIVPVSEKNEASKEVKAALAEAYEVLSAPDVKLSTVMPALSNVTASANVKADDLVVKDLFSVAVSEEIANTLKTQGNKLKLTFDAKVSSNQFVAVMVSVNGEWVPVEFVVNADGSITCLMDVVGVVAILVNP